MKGGRESGEWINLKRGERVKGERSGNYGWRIYGSRYSLCIKWYLWLELVLSRKLHRTIDSMWFIWTYVINISSVLVCMGSRPGGTRGTLLASIFLDAPGPITPGLRASRILLHVGAVVFGYNRQDSALRLVVLWAYGVVKIAALVSYISNIKTICQRLPAGVAKCRFLLTEHSV